MLNVTLGNEVQLKYTHLNLATLFLPPRQNFWALSLAHKDTWYSKGWLLEESTLKYAFYKQSSVSLVLIRKIGVTLVCSIPYSFSDLPTWNC